MNTFLHSHLTDKILGCAIAVHRELGPGLSEYSYQSALALEMAKQTERAENIYREVIGVWESLLKLRPNSEEYRSALEWNRRS